MNFYDRYVLPRLINLVMQSKADRAERAKLIPLASGTVLEVGMGSALNIPFYGSRVRRLYGVDPSLELWRLGRKRVRNAPFPVSFLASSGEHIPLRDMAVDTVVSTWTLCTIPDPRAALAEVRRLLKADGHFLFIEHGLAPEPGVRAWQSRLTPMWKRVAGGCHMDRPIDAVIRGAGFRFVTSETGYGSGPKVLAYLYRGVAQRDDARERDA